MGRPNWLVDNTFCLGLSSSSTSHYSYASFAKDICYLFFSNGSLISANSEH